MPFTSDLDPKIVPFKVAMDSDSQEEPAAPGGEETGIDLVGATYRSLRIPSHSAYESAVVNEHENQEQSPPNWKLTTQNAREPLMGGVSRAQKKIESSG